MPEADRALTSVAEVSRTLMPASSASITEYKAYLDREQPIVQHETRFMDHTNELVTTCAPASLTADDSQPAGSDDWESKTHNDDTMACTFICTTCLVTFITGLYTGPISWTMVILLFLVTSYVVLLLYRRYCLRERSGARSPRASIGTGQKVHEKTARGCADREGSPLMPGGFIDRT